MDEFDASPVDAASHYEGEVSDPWTAEPEPDDFEVNYVGDPPHPDDTHPDTHRAPFYAQPIDRGSGWLPPAVHNVVSSVSSQVEEWRARRTKVRRAEDQIGVTAFAHLPVARGVQRPLVYFALAASNDWDRRAVRTRDAALTLLARALDQRWIAVAVNLGNSLTREAGPASPERVTHDWKRVDRSNDFDLGDAASDLEELLTRDVASLQLRGHEFAVPHVVIFATEPPYVDSAAHSAYLSLTAAVQSVTWLLVGDSDWMEVPPELEKAPSRVLHAEQDGVAILLAEVLEPAQQTGQEPSAGGPVVGKRVIDEPPRTGGKR